MREWYLLTFMSFMSINANVNVLLKYIRIQGSDINSRNAGISNPAKIYSALAVTVGVHIHVQYVCTVQS